MTEGKNYLYLREGSGKSPKPIKAKACEMEGRERGKTGGDRVKMLTSKSVMSTVRLVVVECLACTGSENVSMHYFVDRRAGTGGATPRGTPHSGRCRGRDSGGWCPGTWTAQC